MAPPLPSLNALRAFEAVGRLGSFKEAAEELNVTQTAVSHQVRSLEAQLGHSLFLRSTRRLELTAAGARLLPAASAAFAQLKAAVGALRRMEGQISITTSPGFGARWLAPRLGRFAVAHPDWEVTVRHTTQLLDLEEEGLDAGIRWGDGVWPGMQANLLVRAPLYPLASPRLVEEQGLDRPAALAGATLLHDEDRSEWQEWLLMAGLDPALAERGLVFDDENALIQATIEGQGVGLLPRQLVGSALVEGCVVQPFETALAESNGYYLVYPATRLGNRPFEAFRDYLVQEGAGASA